MKKKLSVDLDGEPGAPHWLTVLPEFVPSAALKEKQKARWRRERQNAVQKFWEEAKQFWDESQHPRHPAGGPEGGQFAPKDGEGASGSPVVLPPEPRPLTAEGSLPFGWEDMTQAEKWEAMRKEIDRAKALKDELVRNQNATDPWADERRANIENGIVKAEADRDAMAAELAKTAKGAPIEIDLDTGDAVPHWLAKAPGDSSALREELERGHVSDSDNLGGGINRSYKITVMDPESGDEFEGVWKGESRAASDFNVDDDGNAPEREVLVSQIDEALGLNLVPTTVMRDFKGDTGSFQLWVEGSSYAGSPWSVINEIPREDYVNLAILDTIAGNMDRHMGNAIIGEDGRLKAIDNGFTFATRGNRRRQDIVGNYFYMADGKTKLTADEQSEWLERLTNGKLQSVITSANISDSAKSLAMRRIDRVIQAVESGDIHSILGE